MSPAEELRQAAQHIREVASKATPGPWLDVDHGDRIIRDPDAAKAEIRTPRFGRGRVDPVAAARQRGTSLTGLDAATADLPPLTHPPADPPDDPPGDVLPFQRKAAT